MIITATLPVLGKHCNAHLVVIGHQRGIDRGIALNRLAVAQPGTDVCRLSRATGGFSGDDIDGSGDGRRAEECRPPSTHHFHTLNHVGRQLLQAIHARKCREDGARVDENLGIGSVQTVDAHLLETTVLAVVFHSDTRLEVESLSQVARIGLLKGLGIHHIHQGGCHATRGFTPVGRYHHPFQVNHVLLYFEVHLQGLALGKIYLACGGLVAHGRYHHSERTLGKIDQMVMAGGVGGSAQSGALKHYLNIGEMFAGMPVGDMPHDIGIRVVDGVDASIGQLGEPHEHGSQYNDI